MTDDRDLNQKRWVDEAEEALNRAAEALKAAWSQTRDARMTTLETAKEAANRLAEAIDHGIEVAKQTWDPSPTESAAAGENGTPATEQTSTEEEE